jgi:hypothetical protein
MLWVRVTVAVIIAIAAAYYTAQAQDPEAARPVEATPRLADGTPNPGRVADEKGVWDVPYIQNMGMRIPGADGKTAAERANPGAARGGAKAEPDVPFLPWSRAIYDYNSRNNSKYDPEGYCLPPGGPRMMATPYPMEIIQQPDHRRVFMLFEGATHIWREIYMDGRPHPQGDELNPTYLGHSVGRWERDALVVDVVGFNENTGSITTAILTPTCCTWWSGSRGRTRRRCITKRRLTTRAPIHGRGPCRGTFRGTPRAS